jgi:hypothetical protein
LRIGRLNLDDRSLLRRRRLLDDYVLLLIRFQIARRLRPRAQFLDRVQHVLLLREESVPELLSQVDFFAHP